MISCEVTRTLIAAEEPAVRPAMLLNHGSTARSTLFVDFIELIAGMEIRYLDVPGPVVIIPKKFQDDRGFLSETYVDPWFRHSIEETSFVQDNHSYSAQAGTIRGIHFQIPPHGQGKLVRVLRGAILDVAIDLRQGSPHFGRHVSAKLSAENWNQLWIPVGFGHGFCTLERDTEVLYKVTSRYHPSSERGIRWDDPDLAIDWGVGPGPVTVTQRDQQFPFLKDTPAYFRYELPNS
jgi:dTDP-4-dehydrorhamnose 3,5-epimerase